MRQLYLIVALILGLVSQPVIAKTIDTSRVSDRAIAEFVDDFLKREVKEREIPGAAIVVIRDGRAILTGSYGVADLHTRAPIDTERSLFRQGSIAKLFGWTLAMQLADEGRLDLDRDINAYLDFRVPAKFGRPVTMRHLMTHTAGFSERVPLVSSESAGLPIGRRLAANMPEQAYAPGSTLAYSNYGAALGAYVVERIAGRPFERLVEERIFRPAGMASSTFEQPLPAALRRRFVSNYSASSRVPARFERVSFPAAGSLTATPADMGRLVAAFLNGGKGPRGPIVSPAALSAMTRLQRPLVPGLDAGLGLGFIVGEHGGVRYAGHGGSMGAAATDLELLPEHGLGWTLSLSGRGFNGSAIPLRQELLRAVINRFFANRAAIRTATESSTAEEVDGVYIPSRRVHSGPLHLFGSLSTLAIQSAAGGELRVEHEDSETRWVPVGRDAFAEAQTGVRLAVVRDGAGNVVRLASPLLNNVTEFERAPTRYRLALPILIAALPVLLLAGLVSAVVALVRHRRSKTRPASRVQAKRNWLQKLRAPSLGLIVATLIVWIAFFVFTTILPGAYTPTLAASLPLIELLSLLCCAAALVLLADAISGWRDRALGGNLAFSVTAVAAASFTWLLAAFGLARLPIAA